MDAMTFYNLPTEDIATLVRNSGPKVCVFPINGTRRWFMLEHPSVTEENYQKAYLEAMIQSYIRLYSMFFEHGLNIVLAPAFGPDLMARGEEYTQMATKGWVQMVNHPDFIKFCESCQVRIRFYGNYEKVFKATPYAHLLEVFNKLSMETAKHNQNRLFFGLFAQDATETIAELSIHYYKQHQCVPDKHTLVELYYGEHVPPVDFFIGFDKFAAFDMPLVSTGNEDLYFTVAPSPYLTQNQLRRILYDHLYMRPEKETDYSEITEEELTLMREFYQSNSDKTLGIGARHQQAKFWYPMPEVKLPDSITRSNNTKTEFTK
jgi:adenosine tuberculosinyltransferase